METATSVGTKAIVSTPIYIYIESRPPTVITGITVLTVRHTSPISNDDVYKVVSTTVGNDVRPPRPASIGGRQRVAGHPQRIISSRYIERHCPN